MDPYEIQQNGIRFDGLFGSWLIRYGDIKSITHVSLWQVLSSGLNPLKPILISYIGMGRIGGPIVLIESATKRVTFIPTDAPQFVRLVSERVAACKRNEQPTEEK